MLPDVSTLDRASQAPSSPPHAPPAAAPAAVPRRFSALADALVGSEILKIAGEIRALMAGRARRLQPHGGRLRPRGVPHPGGARRGHRRGAGARARRTTRRRTACRELRQAVARFYERELGPRYPARLGPHRRRRAARHLLRPIRTLCDPGDRVVYPVPSWNNNHYVHLVGRRRRAGGLPAREPLPARPARTCAGASAARACSASTRRSTPPARRSSRARRCSASATRVLEENARRERRGERPLYLHVRPHLLDALASATRARARRRSCVPEMARYTIFVDGISKAFAATGLRVGWARGAGGRDRPHVRRARPRRRLGAARRAGGDGRRCSTTPAAIARYHAAIVTRRAGAARPLHAGFQAMKRRGLPVESIPPMGAIYLTARFAPRSAAARRTAASCAPTRTCAATCSPRRRRRRPLPGLRRDRRDGWFRLSVGAISGEEIAKLCHGSVRRSRLRVA